MSLRVQNCAGAKGYQWCENSKSFLGVCICVISGWAVSSHNSSRAWGLRDHLDNRSDNLFWAPGRCTARMMHCALAGLHKCISVVPTVDDTHSSLIVAVHLGLGSPQLMAPDPNHQDHCQHLKSWNVESRLADFGRKLRLKELIPTYAHTAG